MPTINALIKKREKLEAQIAAAQRLEKRKAEILTLLEKHGLLDLSDEQILSRLQGAAGPAMQPQSGSSNTITGELE
ncbi:MAG: hypothetical protein AB7S55_10335 [Thiomonas sp.]